MQLRWEMMEPTFARRAALAAAWREAAARAAKNRAAAQNRTVKGQLREPTTREQIVHSAIALSISVGVVLLYLCVALHLTGAVATVAFTLLPMALLTLVIAPTGLNNADVNLPPTVRHTAQERGTATSGGTADHGSLLLTRALRLRGRVSGDTLRALLEAPPGAGAEWTRAECLYGSILGLLADAGKDTYPLSAAEQSRRRELLRRCGVLLAASYRMDQRRQSIDVALAETHGIQPRWREERASFQERLDTESDPVVQAALAQSIEMGEERQHALQTLDTLMTRLEAQEEAVCQALLLARAAFVQDEAGAVARASVAVSSEIAALRQSVQLMTGDMQAGMDAVAEIAQLEYRAGLEPLPLGEGAANAPASAGSDRKDDQHRVNLS